MIFKNHFPLLLLILGLGLILSPLSEAANKDKKVNTKPFCPNYVPAKCAGTTIPTCTTKGNILCVVTATKSAKLLKCADGSKPKCMKPPSGR
ncbi:hypothetical protein DFH28DRAFT_96731 [Melampsora americana]|nr:hypothetical protein DFH28DRAFT_96731 [Melampsora americana]